MIYIFAIALTNFTLFHEGSTRLIIHRALVTHLGRGIVIPIHFFNLARGSVAGRITFLFHSITHNISTIINPTIPMIQSHPFIASLIVPSPHHNLRQT